MKNKYRIVTDTHQGFEAQIKFWWFPIAWFELHGINSHKTVEQAEKQINDHRAGLHKTKVVKVID